MTSSLYYSIGSRTIGQEKVVLYTFVRRGVPVRGDTYSEPSACEVVWPVPFLDAFISPVFDSRTGVEKTI